MPTTFDLHPLIAASMLLLLLFAVDGDLRSRQIPNGLSLGGIALGLILNFTLHGTPGGSDALLGALTGGLLLLPLWLLRGLGGGDVKLMAAVGAHLGVMASLLAALSTLIVGAVIAMVVMLARRRNASASGSTGTPATDFPYAPAIAAGSLFAATWPLLSSAVAP